MVTYFDHSMYECSNNWLADRYLPTLVLQSNAKSLIELLRALSNQCGYLIYARYIPQHQTQ